MHIHIIGVCGTGMASLAGMLRARGVHVTGSDQDIYPPMSTQLQELGIDAKPFSEANLDPAPDLVVVGNAIRRGNPEAELMLDRKMKFTSMPALLQEMFLPGRQVAVVTGTHGKTTTTSMLAWILTDCGRDPSFLIGGIPRNFDASYRLGKGNDFVIEGDEYDTAFFDKGPKFMHYMPDTVVLNAVEFDHADIYPDLEAVRTQFRRLVNIIPRRGLLLARANDPGVRSVIGKALCRVESFGINEGSDWRGTEIEHGETGCTFTVLRKGERVSRVKLELPGEFNVRNGLAAIAAAVEAGVDPKQAVEALAGFRGVRRRQELRGVAAGVLVLDDFAHHPTAIAETLRAVRLRNPARKVWAVLEPRSWSLRRNVFQEQLAAAFSEADHVLVAPVFHADELDPAQRLDVQSLVSVLKARGTDAASLPGAAAIVERVAAGAAEGDVVVAMSNGGFDGFHEKLLAALRVREGVTP
jgi:UDP-N-acetylmuramate: L-alanyl-gamma-D-glutamyl-meso-diaminopimelate ligase